MPAPDGNVATGGATSTQGTTTSGTRDDAGDNAGQGTDQGADDGTQQGIEQLQTHKILDLDTPLAGSETSKRPWGPDAMRLSLPAIIAAGCLGALAVAGIWLLIARRRKARQDEDA